MIAEKIEYKNLIKYGVFAVLFMGVGAYLYSLNTPSNSIAAGVQEPPYVLTHPLMRGDVSEKQKHIAKVEAINSVDVIPQVSGYLEKILFESGAEVKEGEKAILSVVTTDSVYYIDNTKVEEFIKEKAKLAENYKIYSMDNPFIENFIKTDAGYTGKLKTSYVSGPKVTENDVVEIIKGKGLGTAQHDIKDIDGISSIRIDPSCPWVTTIPNDPNRITVILDIQEQ